MKRKFYVTLGSIAIIASLVFSITVYEAKADCTVSSNSLMNTGKCLKMVDGGDSCVKSSESGAPVCSGNNAAPKSVGGGGAQ